MKSKFQSKRGSAMIIALLFATAITISLASYFGLMMTNMRSSHRSYMSTAAMNLAESGLEEALYGINHYKQNGTYPTGLGWNMSGTTATVNFDNRFQVGTSNGNHIQVQITNANLTLNTPPVVTVRAAVDLPNGGSTVRWISTTLDAKVGTSSSPEPVQPPGLVAKYSVVFKGNNARVDSFNSDPNRDGSTIYTYVAGSKDPNQYNDHGFVGSLAVAVDQITVQNADIYGYVSTYQDSNFSNNVGPNGRIASFNSSAQIDPSRISTDFVASLQDPTVPSGVNINALGSVTSSLVLPQKDSKGTIIDTPTTVVIDKTTNTTKTVYYYSTTNVKLTSKGTGITISSGSNVGIISPYGSTIDLSGNGYLTINNGATLDMFVGGDMKATGNGISNGTPDPVSGLTEATMQQASKLHIYGVAPDADNNPATPNQTIDVAGNGVLSAVIYAPNATLSIDGNGRLLGAASANNITLNGNAQFSYDQALGNWSGGRPSLSGANPYRVRLWRELVASADKHF